MARLRGGRGPKADEISSQEFLQNRVEASQIRLAPYFYSAISPDIPTTAGGIWQPTWSFFWPCPPVVAPTRLTHCRLHIQTGTANASFEVALYIQVGKNVKQMGGSRVLFDGTVSDTIYNLALPRPVVLKPNMRVFIGYKAITAATTTHYIPASRSFLGWVNNTDVAANSLPTVANLKESRYIQIHGSTLGVAPIVYLTAEAAILFT